VVLATAGLETPAGVAAVAGEVDTPEAEALLLMAWGVALGAGFTVTPIAAKEPLLLAVAAEEGVTVRDAVVVLVLTPREAADVGLIVLVTVAGLVIVLREADVVGETTVSAVAVRILGIAPRTPLTVP